MVHDLEEDWRSFEKIKEAGLSKCLASIFSNNTR